MPQNDVIRLQAQDYLGLLHLAREASTQPLATQYALLASESESRGPYRHVADRFVRFAQRLTLPDPTESWRETLRNVGLNVANFLQYREGTARLHALVSRHDPAWHELQAEPNGALVMSVHHEFQHLLFVLIGQAGRKLHVIAAPEESSVFAPWLLPQIHRQHRDCAQHFNGGDYLFLDQSSASSGIAITRILGTGGTVLSLHDIGAGSMRSQIVNLFGQRFAAPSGAIEIAMRQQVPIYFAMLLWSWEDFRYHLRVIRLFPSIHAPLQAYIETVEQVVKEHPASWNGWQWLEELGC